MVPDVTLPIDIYKSLQKNGLQCYKSNLVYMGGGLVAWENVLCFRAEK